MLLLVAKPDSRVHHTRVIPGRWLRDFWVQHDEEGRKYPGFHTSVVMKVFQSIDEKTNPID